MDLNALVTEYVDGTRHFCDPPAPFDGDPDKYAELVEFVLRDFVRLVAEQSRETNPASP